MSWSAGAAGRLLVPTAETSSIHLYCALSLEPGLYGTSLWLSCSDFKYLFPFFNIVAHGYFIQSHPRKMMEGILLTKLSKMRE